MTDRASVPGPLVLRVRSFTGLFLRRARFSILLMLIAIGAVLSRTNGEESPRDVKSTQLDDREPFVCLVMRLQSPPHHVQNRVDWCPLR